MKPVSTKKSCCCYKSVISIMLLLLLGLTAWYLKPRGYGFVTQLTASMPQGIYWQAPLKSKINKGESVLFKPDAKLEQLMISRGWIINGVALMKRVYAVSGDRVCVRGHKIFINKQFVAFIKKQDSKHRPLPQWHYCSTVPAEQYLLMSRYAANSFDGRYFGLVNRSQLIARVQRLVGWSS